MPQILQSKIIVCEKFDMSINILLTVTDNTDNVTKESKTILHFSPRHYFQIKLRTKNNSTRSISFLGNQNLTFSACKNQ